jgi:putative drug exporter of the RND superfamily
MRRWTDWVLRHRAKVVTIWLLCAVTGGVFIPYTSSLLQFNFELPGWAGHETNRSIINRFDNGGANDPILLVSTVPPGQSATDPTVLAEFDEVVARAAAATPGSRVSSYTLTGDRAFVGDDDRTLVAAVFPVLVEGPDFYVDATPALQRVTEGASVAGAPVEMTGTSELEGEENGSDRGLFAEVLIGAGGALVVLALVFGSFVAVVPLIIAAFAILSTFLLVLGLASTYDTSFVVQFLVGLIGLGVAIDYSLLVVMRWREERSRGVDNETAVRTAAGTAGRSVVFSGITVAVSLAALIALPLPFLRSIGFGGLLIPLVSVLAAVTLLPIILITVGPRLEWPRRSPRDPSSRMWAWIAGVVVRYKVLAAVASTALLVVLTLPAFGLNLGSPQLSSYPSDKPSAQTAARMVEAGIPPGVLRPIQVVAPTGGAAATAEQLRGVPGVGSVIAPPGADWARDGDVLLDVWIDADPATVAGKQQLAAVRAAAAALPGVRVGGSPAEDADFVSAVYGNIWVVIVLIVVVTVVLLARALRSVWLPVKALVLNVLSIGAAYGITVLIWQDGYGVGLLFGMEPTGAVVPWVPVAVFAFLFGLSMDYEVFILSRMREAYDEGESTEQAVVSGISSTGRLVTSGALILFLAFVGLSTVPAGEVKVLATTLALGILIDAVIVRTVLAPALVVLLGRANWWLPPWMARLLRVEPSVARSVSEGELPGAREQDADLPAMPRSTSAL